MLFENQQKKIATYNFSEVAKILNINGVGRNKLMEILRELNILDSWNFAYDEYVNAGYFTFRARVVTRNHIYGASTVEGMQGVDFIKEKVEEYKNKQND